MQDLTIISSHLFFYVIDFILYARFEFIENIFCIKNFFYVYVYFYIKYNRLTLKKKLKNPI